MSKIEFLLREFEQTIDDGWTAYGKYLSSTGDEQRQAGIRVGELNAEAIRIRETIIALFQEANRGQAE